MSLDAKEVLRRRWFDERQSAWLYGAVAAAEPDAGHRRCFEELGKASLAQAKILANDLGETPAFQPSARARVVAAMVKRIGPRHMRGVLSAMKIRGLQMYDGPVKGHPMPASVKEIGARHKRGGSGALRAAVFGVNDGLVSNTSLILGMAGAGERGNIVLLTGLAGMLAGAFSMAAGEYISMRSQREMFEYQIAQERAELERYPEEEAEELAMIYAARGVPIETAREVAAALIKNPQQALDTLAREELGLDPDELGSPWGAAASSFAAFSAGAIVPLAPFALGAASPLPIAIGLAGVALATVGAVLSLFSGRRAIYGGARMLLIGGLAGAATFGIGQLIGVSVS
jgi:vacuolar iron transporter family protein